ncbi:SEFIR domain-containing protein [Burkholderia sp. PAMC 26561]|uniref:SEFIR domain-containing protein n=1 Tax=Burkholderia sp. PAMC 26561 TaxID=1795043 RepID=UPI00084CF616|nr:TIR domain-containing protein [Burkholderia sp. PAMC 26561]
MMTPRVFISYSWSNEEHQNWVLSFSTELVESGVDVVLDKWDLREGDDSIQFMESMVTDERVKKVLIISDRTYAEKADGRHGGVGTETQIISPRVFAQQDDRKFLAIVTSRDKDGDPYLPVFYGSRIYIDLSDAATYSENFDRILRWIFDKPFHVKPKLGSPPSFLNDVTTPSLGTSSAYRRAVESIKNGRPTATGAIADFFRTFSTSLDTFRSTSGDEQFDVLIANLEAVLPARNEAIQVFIALAQYASSLRNAEEIHRFIESVIAYDTIPSGVMQYRETDADFFKFVMHELFLYALAVFIKFEKFDVVQLLLTKLYYGPISMQIQRQGTESYSRIWQPLKSLEIRNQKLQLRRLSLRADLLIERVTGTGISTTDLMQADFIAFLRAAFHKTGIRWHPETLLYALNKHDAFEVFARAKSKTYCAQLEQIFGVSLPPALAEVVANAAEGRYVPRWDWQTLDIAVLANAADIGRLP